VKGPLALAMSLLVAGCNIIIEGKAELEPPPVGWPADASSSCQALATYPLPTAQLIMLVRLSRATLGVAPEIDAVYRAVKASLFAEHYLVSHAVVAPLVANEELTQPFYWESCATPPPRSLLDVLVFYASRSTVALGQGNPHALLARLGKQLAQERPAYPQELVAAYRASDVPFVTAPASRLVVVYVDLLPRECALEGCDIDGTPIADYFSAEEGGSLSWLSIAGQSLPADSVTHLAVVTDESGEARPDFVARCLAEPGFRLAAIDFMTPSPNAYFAPFVARLGKASAKRASLIDACSAFAADGPALIAAALAGVGSVGEPSP
jgi:hypothetical protein